MSDLPSGDIDCIFKEMAHLLEAGAPDFPEFSQDAVGLPTDFSQTFLDILNSVPNVEVVHTVPWSGWLLKLCVLLTRAMEGLGEIASVAHLAAVRSCVSRLVTFAVLPNTPCVLPYPFDSKSTVQLSVRQKRVVVDVVLRLLVLLLKDGHTRGAVLRHYGELVGSLVSLHSVSTRQADAETSQSDEGRQLYKQTVTHLLDDVHQPTVFTHLMILLSTKGDGGKVCRVVRRILESKLQMSGGVAALLAATVMSDQAGCSSQHVVKIATLLTGKHPPAFYQAVLPQVLDLLKQTDNRCHQVAANCILLLQERDPGVCEQYLMTPLLRALETQCTEGDIDNCVLRTGRWIDCAPVDTVFSRPLPLLCLLYASVVATPCSLKGQVSEVLTSCFESLQLPCPYILSCLFPPHPGVIYSMSPSCTAVSEPSDRPLLPEDVARSVMQFISEKKLNKIKVELYQGLLQHVVDALTPLTEKLVSTQLLTELSSDQVVLDSISAEPRHLIDFLLDLFTNEPLDSESVSLGLVLLTVFLQDSLIRRKANWTSLAKLHTPLTNLKRSSHFEIRTLSQEIITRLKDVGILSPETMVDSSEENIQVNTISNSGLNMPTDYVEAIKESMDPHLPVRAHALRTLAKLLRSNDKTTLNNKTTLLNLFMDNLDDSDSYVYLSAIDGLSSLASVLPDEIVNILCREFTDRQGKPELRLKIGQVLVKTTNLLGDVGAVYKRELLHCMLSGVDDPDPLVRASSLSNIGEIAKIISFRIYDFLIEILDAVERLLDTEKELEPRRAAVMLISLLLQGLGQHTFTVLEEILPQLYRKLRLLYETEKDDVTRLHAQIALEELASTTRALLFPQQSLTKRISNIDINK